MMKIIKALFFNYTFTYGKIENYFVCCRRIFMKINRPFIMTFFIVSISLFLTTSVFSSSGNRGGDGGAGGAGSYGGYGGHGGRGGSAKGCSSRRCAGSAKKRYRNKAHSKKRRAAKKRYRSCRRNGRRCGSAYRSPSRGGHGGRGGDGIYGGIGGHGGAGGHAKHGGIGGGGGSGGAGSSGLRGGDGGKGGGAN
jgi:hypothetical protein